MKLSVIIVSYHSAPYLEKCLLSVRRHFAGVSHEIIVVDNHSRDQSVSIARKFPEVRVIERLENGGFAKGVNEGLRASAGEYCLWLNPDAEIKNNGIEDLLAYMDREKKTGIAGARILNPDGSVQLSCRSFPGFSTAVSGRYSLLTKLFPNNPLSRKYLNSDFGHTEIKKVDWVSGACLLHRRGVLETTGFPDENYFMFCEDVDFCFRASADWDTVYFPGFEIMHHIGGSGRSRRLIAEHHSSMWKYYKKNFKRNPALDILTGAAILARCSFVLAVSLFKRSAA